MKLLLILYSFALYNCVKSDQECDGFTIDGAYYTKEVLKADISPLSLATDYGTNTLYFSFEDRNAGDKVTTARLNLITGEYSKINVEDGMTQTVDQKSHDVYIGTSKGIYKYDSSTDKAELHGAEEFDLWSVYFNDSLYFITFPYEFLYVFKDGEVVREKSFEDFKVNGFVKDEIGEIVFVNVTGIYRTVKNDTVLLKEDGNVRNIVTDVEGIVYVVLMDGVVFKVSRSNLIQVAEIDEVRSIAFDKDNNIIMSNATSIMLLVKNPDKSCNDGK